MKAQNAVQMLTDTKSAARLHDAIILDPSAKQEGEPLVLQPASRRRRRLQSESANATRNNTVDPGPPDVAELVALGIRPRRSVFEVGDSGGI